ncbi:hypothetical protein XANCAGTX0491_008010 [Xanthoria calcicola]
MSRSQNLLTAAVVVGLGVISGRYIFRPAIEDLEKEKRGMPLEESVSSAQSKEETPRIVPLDDAKSTAERIEHSPPMTDSEVDSKGDSGSTTITNGLPNQGLPPFLQPWDSRKR